MNKTLEFNKGKTLNIIKYSVKPVINIIRISLVSSNKNWVNKIFSTNLIIKITAFNADNEEIYSEQNPLSFGAFISPYSKQPILEVNQTFRITGQSVVHNLNKCNNWKAEIILNNLSFGENDSLSVEYMDTNYIARRVDNWENRINELIGNITNWVQEDSNLSVKPSRKIKMYEKMMEGFGVSPREINSIDVIRNNKVIMALKPFGLWTLGANGRVDLLTAKRNYILVDKAERFETPQWQLFTETDIKKGIELTQESFLKLLAI